MSKHTPGPLHFRGVWQSNNGCRINDEHGNEVARAFSSRGEAYDRALACRIAALPDLLAALQEYARLTSPEYEEGCKRGEHLYPDVDLAAARKAALAAIARATGGDHE